MKKITRNTRWEDMAKGNIELGRLKQHFESYNKSENKSERTVEWYNEALSQFQKWLLDQKIPTKLQAIGEDEVRDFIVYLRDQKIHGHSLSTSTISNRVRALRAFFAWLKESGYTKTHRLLDLKPPVIPEGVIEPLTPVEVDSIFSCMNQNSALGARNRAIVSLFLDTGLRLSELANLKEPDVHLDQRYVKVLGKGRKERIVPLGTTCQQTLLHYYHHFRPAPANSNIDCFFLDFDGYPLSPRGLASLIVRLSITSGVKRLHPHLFRHTYATRFLINGGDVFLLKQNLGHSTLAMVEHYRHIASREAAILSETFSPLDRMNLKELRTRQRNHNSNGPIYPNAGFQRCRNNFDDANLKNESGERIRNHSRMNQSRLRPSSSKGHNRRKA